MRSAIKKNKAFIIFISILFALIMLTNIINNRFNLHDFEVYYSASKHMTQDLPVYNQSFGLPSGIFKYAPLSLFLFVPLAILPFALAKVIFYLLIAAVFTLLLIYLDRSLHNLFYRNSDHTGKSKILFFATLICAAHLHRELHLGNVNILLLGLLVLALKWMIEDRHILAGLLTGIAILVKPHFLVLLPLFLLTKKHRALLTSGTTIVAGFIVPVLFLGFDKTFRLHQQWFNTMAIHNSSAEILASPDTIQTILYKLLLQYFLPEVNSFYNYVVILIVALLIFSLLMYYFKLEKNKTTEERSIFRRQSLVLLFYTIIALVPNITKTDTEHFLFSLPLIIYLLTYANWSEYKSRILLIIIVCTFFLYGGNWHDLWGARLSDWMAENGFLGIGNILIVILSNFIFLVFNRKSDIVDNAVSA